MDPATIAAIAGPVISAGAGLYGAHLNRKATADANAANLAIANKNLEMQEKFAQQGIRWKVDDAAQAGIHPLYALGANTHSFSPVSVGAVADHSMGQAMANIGQDVSRAITATSTNKERELAQMKILQLEMEGKQLDNDFKRSQLIKMNQVGPPLPSNSDMPLLTGQGNGYATGRGGAYVNEVPLQRVHSQPGAPAQEVGAIPDYGFARTNSGLTPVPSKDVKEKIEDSFIPETMWAIRNQFLPNVGLGPKPPDPRYYPVPKGADGWKWNHLYQEYQPFRGWRGKNDPGGYMKLKGGM